MRVNIVARVYVETLLRRAEQEDVVEPVTNGLAAFAQCLNEDTRLRRFLEAPQITTRQKQAVVEEALESRVHPLVVQFLGLVIDRHRELLLPEIAMTWQAILDERANRQTATITSASPLDPTTVASLGQALERVTGKTIVIEEKVQPKLLGGVVVQTGDLVMDASLKTRLGNLGRQLRSSNA
ncbi:MAG: ATP synthase F1 subunit delta [Gemmatimonadota bacterium]